MIGEEGCIVSERDYLNELLIKTFFEALRNETKFVITEEYKEITMNDMHVMEHIGVGKGKPMSMLAKELGITVGSLTIAINGLVKKGYVRRVRSEEDRRVVLVSLTGKGQGAYYHHQKFHESMVEKMYQELTADQIELLIKTLETIHGFMDDGKWKGACKDE